MSDSRVELSLDVAEILSDYYNLLYVSSLSIIEIVFLLNNNKIRTKYRDAEGLIAAIDKDYYVQTFQTKPEHIDVYARLQPVDGHKDQIDHFIIAQSICEKMPLISSDRKFFGYREQGLDFIYNRR
ncbi:MAG: PIN domain-containing protein [Chryseobacterium sp.]|nr:MAG: PIN domain-containing protein [Chryseobacterium sp.]